MNPLRATSDWLKYQRLHHYSALKPFERQAAIKRLHAYELEERKACQPWLNLALGLIVALGVAWIVLGYVSPVARAFGIVCQIPAWVLQYVLHRRIRRRVDAKVAAELRDGRLWTCVECGYDLRASEDRCPECGASVRAGPDMSQTGSNS